MAVVCIFALWATDHTDSDQRFESYFTVAARLGDADAQQDLAFCLANGKGCKKNKKEAARWYRAAVSKAALSVNSFFQPEINQGCAGSQRSWFGLDIQGQVPVTIGPPGLLVTRYFIGRSLIRYVRSQLTP